MEKLKIKQQINHKINKRNKNNLIKKFIKFFINFLIKKLSLKIKNFKTLILIAKIIIVIVFCPFILFIWVFFIMKQIMKSIFLMIKQIINFFFSKIKKVYYLFYELFLQLNFIKKKKELLNINIKNLTNTISFRNKLLISKTIILLLNNKEIILEKLLEQEEKRKLLFILNQTKKLDSLSSEELKIELKGLNLEELKVSNLLFFCNNENEENICILNWDDILYPSDLENLQIKNENYSFNCEIKNKLLKKFYNKRLSVKEIENLLNNKNIFKKEINSLNSFLNLINIDKFLEFENYKFKFLIELLEFLELNKNESIFYLMEAYIKFTSNFNNAFFNEEKYLLNLFYNLNFEKIKEVEVKENYIRKKSIKNFFTFDNDLKYHEYSLDDLYVTPGDFVNMQYTSWTLFFLDKNLFLKQEHGLDFFLLSPNEETYKWIKENNSNLKFKSVLLEDQMAEKQLDALYQYYLKINESKNLIEKNEEWMSDIQNDEDEPFYIESQNERFVYKNFFYYNYTEIIFLFWLIFFIFILINFDLVYLFCSGIIDGDKNIIKFFEKISYNYFWKYEEILVDWVESFFRYFKIYPCHKPGDEISKFKFFDLMTIQLFFFFIPFSFFKYNVFTYTRTTNFLHDLFEGKDEEWDDLNQEHLLNHAYLKLYLDLELSHKCFIHPNENHLLNLINFHLIRFRIRFNKIYNSSILNNKLLLEYIRLLNLYPFLNLKTLLFVKYRHIMQNYFFEIFNAGLHDDIVGPTHINIFYFNYKDIIYERLEDINTNKNINEIDFKIITGNPDVDLDNLNKFLKKQLVNEKDYLIFIRSYLKGLDVLNTSFFFLDLRIYDFRNDQEVDITIEGNEELYKIFKDFYLTYYQKDKPEHEVDELWLLWRFIYYIHFWTTEGKEAAALKGLFLSPEEFWNEKIFPALIEKVINVEQELLNEEYLKKMNKYNEHKEIWLNKINQIKNDDE